jgi:hypothetical protein
LHRVVVLRNNYSETLDVSAKAVLIDLEGTSLADTVFGFPPVEPSGKGRKDVTFHSSSVAGGRCPDEFDVKVTPSLCMIVGPGSMGLRGEYC